uniref:endo-polygalacturonase n=1 Tax=Monilinia fructicola TaxID=38448 RepID=A0A059SVT2_MONFR|nr:polygalacturonase 3 [Monilinia fructicola]
MRSAIILGFLASIALACDNPKSPGHACASAFAASPVEAASFCATYTKSVNTATTGLPPFATACANKPKKLSSACSCLQVPTTLATLVSSAAPSVASDYPSVVNATYVRGSYARAPTPPAYKPAPPAYKPAHKPAKTKVATSTPVPVPAGGAPGPIATAAPPAPAGCKATAYSNIAGIVAKCTNIVLHNIAVPAGATLDLQKLRDGSTVTFSGTTTFGTTPISGFDPIVINGRGITITGAPGHVIEGNGAAYWDGLGSNGGSKKPNHFIVVEDVVNTVITNLNIKNWPVHCFYINRAQGLTISGLILDNSAGDAPNSKSKGDEASHNSDGFDISASDRVTIKNTVVKNQDDCVAVTSGTNILVTGMTCSGGHGLSIGSIGGKSNNVVSGVTFSDSTITNSRNGCRIKSNSGTTGLIENITYSNIKMSGITKYGLVIQQDYLNGGPTGKPTNGVIIRGINFSGVTGTTVGSAINYYILCGSGSCSNFKFQNVRITGGGKPSTCNYPSTGCPA